jgi:three-Cys-motif partner protein
LTGLWVERSLETLFVILPGALSGVCWAAHTVFLVVLGLGIRTVGQYLLSGDISMATPSGTVWDRDEHTEAKHIILSAYLGAWFPILMSNSWKGLPVTFVDAFAGPGEYSDGAVGSPVIALRMSNSDKLVASRSKVTLVFVEEDSSRSDHLERVLAREANPLERDYIVLNGTCEDLLPQALQDVGAAHGPLFINFDGWGVDTTYEQLRASIIGPAPEVLVTLNTQWLMRFAEVEFLSDGDAFYGGTEWRKVAGFDNSQSKKDFLIQEYRSVLRKVGLEYHLVFELVSKQGQSLMLIFGSTSTKAVEKMKDAMWSVDTLHGSTFRDPRDPNQLRLDFPQPEANLSSLSAQLVEYIKERGTAVPLSELKEHTLLETIYRPQHTLRSVNQLDAAGKVICKRAKRHEKFMVELPPVSLFDYL